MALHNYISTINSPMDGRTIAVGRPTLSFRTMCSARAFVNV